MRTLASVAAVVLLGLTVSTAGTKADCVKECNQRLRDKTKICDVAFRQDGNTQKHRECLGAARSEFDACVSHCD